MSVLNSRFEFKPSRFAALLIAGGGVIASVSMLIIPIPLPLQLLAAGIVAALFARALYQRALLYGGSAVCGVIFRANNTVIVLDKNGGSRDMGNILYCYVSPALSTMVIAGNRRRYRAMIMPDSLPAEDYRHLRIRLNTGDGKGRKDQNSPASAANK